VGEARNEASSWLTWLVAASVLAVGIGTAVVLANGRKEDPSTDTTVDLRDPTTTTTTDGHSGGSGSGRGRPASEVVEVVDKGWTVDDRERAGSYAFEIENTGDEAIGSFLVRVKAWDRSGQLLSGIDDWKVVVGTMQPGERLGIADDLDSPDMADDGISRLEVVVAELASDPLVGIRSPAKLPDGTVHVSHVTSSRQPATTTVSYTVDSTYGSALDADAYVVFRDAGGKIVGGVGSFVDLPAHGSVHADFDVHNNVIPDEVASTAVYVVPQLSSP
jgi:hypothetical protein